MSTSSYRIGGAHVKRIGLRNRTGNPDRPADRNHRLIEESMEQRTYLQEERWRAVRAGTETTPGSHWVIARLNEIQHLGRIDRKGGVYHTYQGPVGAGAAREEMTAQVTEYDGDLCISFWTRDGRCRRLLVTARGQVWIAIGLQAIVHSGKYLRAWNAIARVRVTHLSASASSPSASSPAIGSAALTAAQKGGQ